MTLRLSCLTFSFLKSSCVKPTRFPPGTGPFLPPAPSRPPDQVCSPHRPLALRQLTSSCHLPSQVWGSGCLTLAPAVQARRASEQTMLTGRVSRTQRPVPYEDEKAKIHRIHKIRPRSQRSGKNSVEYLHLLTANPAMIRILLIFLLKVRKMDSWILTKDLLIFQCLIIKVTFSAFLSL